MNGLSTRSLSTGALLALALGLVLHASDARAQLSAPAQPPAVDSPGTFVLTPRAVVLDDDAFTDGGFVLDARYGVTHGISVHGHAGGLVGDLDAFTFGAGLKARILEQGSDGPVDLSGVTTLGVVAGDDATIVTWLAGPLLGHSFQLESTRLTPYGGLGLGIAHRDYDQEFEPSRDDGDTELAAGLTFGGEAQVARDLSIGSELTLGLADGLPDVSWGVGVSFAF